VKTFLVASLIAILAAPALAAESKPAVTAPAKPELPAKGPRLAVEPESFDFGKALQNKTLTKEFSIRNFGTEDLIIENVATTCGCTAALVDNKIVKPGGSAPMRVELQTRTASGKLERSVIIRSNDPRKTLEVKVQADVVPAAAK
jgi:Protein of unknown function (DUF1573)